LFQLSNFPAKNANLENLKSTCPTAVHFTWWPRNVVLLACAHFYIVFFSNYFNFSCNFCLPVYADGKMFDQIYKNYRNVRKLTKKQPTFIFAACGMILNKNAVIKL
jgi:hypothetical protein